MPSAALLKFESNLLVDVDRLIESHGQLNHQGMGRRGLGHITRSGVLMLCAAWELYVEELLIESAQVIIDRATSPDDLPVKVQREIAKAVRDSKHNLNRFNLPERAGGVCTSTTHAHECKALIPRRADVDTLYHRLVGVPELSNCWSIGANAVDSFVTARGDIAHRGRDAQYVIFGRLIDYKGQIVRTVLDTDNFLANLLRQNTQGGAPWRRRPVV